MTHPRGHCAWWQIDENLLKEYKNLYRLVSNAWQTHLYSFSRAHTKLKSWSGESIKLFTQNGIQDKKKHLTYTEKCVAARPTNHIVRLYWPEINQIYGQLKSDIVANYDMNVKLYPMRTVQH